MTNNIPNAIFTEETIMNTTNFGINKERQLKRCLSYSGMTFKRAWDSFRRISFYSKSEITQSL